MGGACGGGCEAGKRVRSGEIPVEAAGDRYAGLRRQPVLQMRLSQISSLLTA